MTLLSATLIILNAPAYTVRQVHDAAKFLLTSPARDPIKARATMALARIGKA